jgi:hypothetical protein
MAVGNAAIRRTRSRRAAVPPHVEKFVAQPGQTTIDSRVPANEKEETRSRQAQNKGSPRHFVTYPAASVLKRSTYRGRCCVLSQAAGQSEKPGNARQSNAATCQPTARAARESVNARQWPGDTTIYGQIARRPQATGHSTARPRKGHDQMRSPTRRASRTRTAIEEPRAASSNPRGPLNHTGCTARPSGAVSGTSNSYAERKVLLGRGGASVALVSKAPAAGLARAGVRAARCCARGGVRAPIQNQTGGWH